jgi:DNA ligase-1
MRTFVMLAALISLAATDSPAGDTQPELMLANVYRTDIDLADYWVSEKYDGIRAYWDGSTLQTRNGNRIHAPEWFTAHWPQTPLDGELWIGRGQFEAVSAAVRDEIADDAAWRDVQYMVFDLPAHPGPFRLRLAALQALLSADSPSAPRVVPQWQVRDEHELLRQLDNIVASGGEGLMLHRGSSLYRAGRTDDLLKLKPYEDAEARVVGYVPGRGKYENMLGALQVERPDGLRFSLGTGFTDEQRRHPPAIGTWVTYAFHGLTANGVPRFARFLRVRTDVPAMDASKARARWRRI